MHTHTGCARKRTPARATAGASSGRIACKKKKNCLKSGKNEVSREGQKRTADSYKWLPGLGERKRGFFLYREKDFFRLVNEKEAPVAPEWRRRRRLSPPMDPRREQEELVIGWASGMPAAHPVRLLPCRASGAEVILARVSRAYQASWGFMGLKVTWQVWKKMSLKDCQCFEGLNNTLHRMGRFAKPENARLRGTEISYKVCTRLEMWTRATWSFVLKTVCHTF